MNSETKELRDKIRSILIGVVLDELNDQKIGFYHYCDQILQACKEAGLKFVPSPPQTILPLGENTIMTIVWSEIKEIDNEPD